MDGSNHFAMAMFAMLWMMRLSSKLNLFLGVPMLNAELLPPQLLHLRSYFRRQRMNPLLPVSVLVAAIVMVLLILRGKAPEAGEFNVPALCCWRRCLRWP